MKNMIFYYLSVFLIGLLWLGCDIPVSPMPDVGDEMRLTNDPGPNYDPFEYSLRLMQNANLAQLL